MKICGSDFSCDFASFVLALQITSYAHGATELLAVQIDAAINPGKISMLCRNLSNSPPRKNMICFPLNIKEKNLFPRYTKIAGSRPLFNLLALVTKLLDTGAC